MNDFIKYFGPMHEKFPYWDEKDASAIWRAAQESAINKVVEILNQKQSVCRCITHVGIHPEPLKKITWMEYLIQEIKNKFMEKSA
jgi:hypothetical protein